MLVNGVYGISIARWGYTPTNITFGGPHCRNIMRKMAQRPKKWQEPEDMNGDFLTSSWKRLLGFFFIMSLGILPYAMENHL